MNALDDNWTRKGQTLVERAEELAARETVEQPIVETPKAEIVVEPVQLKKQTQPTKKPVTVLDNGKHYTISGVEHEGQTIDVAITRDFAFKSHKGPRAEWDLLIKNHHQQFGTNYQLPSTRLYHNCLAALSKLQFVKGQGGSHYDLLAHLTSERIMTGTSISHWYKGSRNVLIYHNNTCLNIKVAAETDYANPAVLLSAFFEANGDIYSKLGLGFNLHNASLLKQKYSKDKNPFVVETSRDWDFSRRVHYRPERNNTKAKATLFEIQ